MDYETMIMAADSFAAQAHEGQTDHQGVPYIEHPRTVASFLSDPKLKVIALLHDVMEDTDTSEDTIRRLFGDEVTEVLLLLTHDKSQPYREYIRKLSCNAEAREVKLADLRHNMDLTRFHYISQKDIDFFLERYVPAWNFLKNGGDY